MCVIHIYIIYTMETKCTARSLAEYEMTALRNKVNKMQTQINKLTSENTSLKAKVTTLETLIAHLYAQLNITMPCDNDGCSDVAFPFTLEQQWLYHITPLQKYNKDKVLTLLNLNESTSTHISYIELHATWMNESEMYMNIIQHFEQFKEFTHSFTEMKPKHMNKLFKEIFQIVLLCDVVIVIKAIPSLQHNKQQHDNIINNISTLAGTMYTCYTKGKLNHEQLGTMAMILESEDDLTVLNVFTSNQELLVNIKPL